MVEGAISKDATRKGRADAAEEGHRRELLRLFDALQTETAGLSRTHREAADRIARCAERFAQEVSQPKRNSHSLKLAVEDLKNSIEKFEASHPRLVQIVSAISATLANMGI